MLPRRFVPLALLLPLLSCRVQWRWAGSVEDEVPGEAVEVESREARVHGHRDYLGTIEEVWRATIEAVHTRGIPVPKSARVVGEQGRVDTDALWLRAMEDPVGETCVEVVFRGLREDLGRARAEELLDEIGGRIGER